MINLKVFVVNEFGVNSFIMSDESGECIFIDAGYHFSEEENSLLKYIEANKLKPVMLLCTHCHVDHILGNHFILNHFNIPFYIHKEEDILLKHMTEMGNMFGLKTVPSPSATNFIDESFTVNFGNSELKIFHVPGHSPGSLAYYSATDKFLIAGDVLFKGSIGRTDLPGGDYDLLIKSISSKLLVLPPETVVYPGHGPATTIKTETDTNPFFK